MITLCYFLQRQVLEGLVPSLGLSFVGPAEFPSLRVVTVSAARDEVEVPHQHCRGLAPEVICNQMNAIQLSIIGVWREVGHNNVKRANCSRV